jgi:hypothetical protein
MPNPFSEPGSEDTPSGPPRVEPSAAMRAGAASVFEMFTAHVDAGFTESQATQIVCAFMQGAAMRNGQ